MKTKNKKIIKNLVGGLALFSLLHPFSIIITDIGYSKNSAHAIEYSYKAECTYQEIISLKNEALDFYVKQLFDSAQKPKEKLESLNEKVIEYKNYTELTKDCIKRGMKWKNIRDTLAKPYPKSLKNKIWPKTFKEIVFDQISHKYLK